LGHKIDMDLAGKKVCLVLCCKRPYYVERRRRYAGQYNAVEEKGFTTIFLYGEGGRRELVVEEGEWRLYVPVEDLYKNLSRKMSLAYEYLLAAGITGVLKVDDDVQIRDPGILDGPLLESDYSGAEQFAAKGGYEYPLKTTSYMWMLDVDVTYFTGPFYWLSAKGMAQVLRVGPKYPLEDLNTGHAISLDPSLKVYSAPIKNRGVIWYDEHEHDV